jgi:xanthine dehydrogenase YagR molybdenum-binding subunit
VGISLERHDKEAVKVTHHTKLDGGDRFSMRTFGVHFVEVRVDPDLGTVRVARAVSRIAAGRIVNPEGRQPSDRLPRAGQRRRARP